MVDFIRYMPVVAFVPLTTSVGGNRPICSKLLIIFIGTSSSRCCCVMDNVNPCRAIS